MKKLVVLSIVAILAMGTLVGCGGRETECEICGDFTTCTEVEFEGETGWVCEECEEGLDALSELNDTLEDFDF